jgi:hypothetical protein
LRKKSYSPLYIFFYILFSPFTWQVLTGFVLAFFLAPVVILPEMGAAGQIMLYVMIATIGFAASAKPARGIVRGLKKVILT